MQRAIFFALVATTLFSFTAPASAAPAGEAVSARVSFADLDIDSQAGADALITRLERTATRMCRPNRSGPQLQTRAQSATCRNNAVRDAVTRLDAPVVTALYIARGRDERTQFAARE